MSSASENQVYITGGNDERSFSGCSYYFTRSMKARAPELRLSCIPFQNYRAMRSALLKWGMRFSVDPRPYFYMTHEYHECNWVSLRKIVNREDSYISFSQIIPNSIRKSECNVLLMTDMTLSQYLQYEHFGDIPKRISAELLSCEQMSYDRASRIFAATEVTADQLMRIYHVPASKIEVIGRGVNLPIDLSVEKTRTRPDERPMQIVFVGHDYRRKGLPTLLEAIESTVELQTRVVVNAIGPRREEFAPRDWLKVHGYIDKKVDLKKYTDIISSSDLGYLFSQSEGIPGSILEFMHLGIPCLMSDIPEMASIRHSPGVVSVPLDSGHTGVRDRLLEYVTNPMRLEELKRQASKNTFREWHMQAEMVARWL